MAYNISRLTLYAVLSAIEDDLRSNVETYLGQHLTLEEIMQNDPALFSRVKQRHQQDSVESSTLMSLQGGLKYLDFADPINLLNANLTALPEAAARAVQTTTQELQNLAAVRNRVMHGRPLQHDDLARTLDLARDFVKANDFFWPNLKALLRKLRDDPAAVMTLKIPDAEVGAGAYPHNLPIPEFDETGFIGRAQSVAQIVALCKGAFPIITIVGEGGVGKTSLALKAAYELLDADNNPFEAIVWTSSKTSTLTPTHVKTIEGAISDSLGLVKAVGEFLAGSQETDPFDEVIEYLAQFRILLILDNLETVLDERLRSFLARTPPGSKMLMTSRIGVGAYEHPVKLTAMTNAEAVQLLRTLAKLRGTGRLTAVSNKELEVYCDRMMNNPGFIKWFVTAVQAGARPEEVLGKPDLFLDYCMSNVYQYLTESSRSVLQTLQYLSGGHSQAKIAFLSNMDPSTVQVALQQLLTTNMISFAPVPKGRSYESLYEISSLARDYLQKAHPLSVDIIRTLKARRGDLVRLGEELRAGQQGNPYSARTIAIRSPNDLIIGKYLTDAMRYIAARDFGQAEKVIGDAKKLAPEFYEVHRVEAWLRVAQDNYYGARMAYEAAVELEPAAAALRLWFGGFLMRYLDETEEALTHLMKAHELDPNSFRINREIACAYMYLHQYDKAEAMIAPLLLRTDAGEHDRLTAYDLSLQVHQRRADHSYKAQELREAVASLVALRAAFERIPKWYVDADMRTIIVRGRDIAKRCVRFAEGRPDDLATLEEVIRWFSGQMTVDLKLTGDGRRIQASGYVARLPHDRKFGFIRLEDGREAFFHSSEVISAVQFEQMVVGDKVVLEAVDEPRGLAALNVEVKR